MKKVVILVNLGTPEQPDVPSVRKYLKEFLSDPRVLNMPWLFRQLLLNVIILPFRTPRSAQRYKLLWTPQGSPLAVHLKNLTEKLRDRLAGRFDVYPAMRYGEPSFRRVMTEVLRRSPDEICVLPLFPQYATSTTASVRDVADACCASFPTVALRFVEDFYAHPDYLRVMAEKVRSYQPDEYDAVLFSYHGVPFSQLKVRKEGPSCRKCQKEGLNPVCSKSCYWMSCCSATRLISKEAGLNEQKVHTAFQSRLTNGWLAPFTDEVIASMPQKGVKKLLVVAPSFVADCLETTIELGVDYQALFMEKGGEKFTLVQSLNDDASWADALTRIIRG